MAVIGPIGLVGVAVGNQGLEVGVAVGYGASPPLVPPPNNPSNSPRIKSPSVNRATKSPSASALTGFGATKETPKPTNKVKIMSKIEKRIDRLCINNTSCNQE